MNTAEMLDIVKRKANEIIDSLLDKFENNIRSFDQMDFDFVSKAKSSADIKNLFVVSHTDYEYGQIRIVLDYEKTNKSGEHFTNSKPRSIRLYYIPNNIASQLKKSRGLDEAKKKLFVMLDIVNSYRQHIIETLLHELVHFLESIQGRLDSNKTGKLTKVRRRMIDKLVQKGLSKDEILSRFYYNTPHEYNAYFLEFVGHLEASGIDDLREAIDEMKAQKFFKMMDLKYQKKMLRRLFTLFK